MKKLFVALIVFTAACSSMSTDVVQQSQSFVAEPDIDPSEIASSAASGPVFVSVMSPEQARHERPSIADAALNWSDLVAVELSVIPYNLSIESLSHQNLGPVTTEPVVTSVISLASTTTTAPPSAPVKPTPEGLHPNYLYWPNPEYTHPAIYAAANVSGLSAEEMFMIADCESTGKWDVVSDTHDHGLFQHHAPYGPPRFEAVGYTWEDRFDPYANALAAGWYRNQLGRWGGSSGWVCARIVGLH